MQSVQRKTVLLVAVILMLTTTGLFAQGEHEKNGKGQKEAQDPAISATIKISQQQEETTASLAGKYAGQIITLDKATSIVQQDNSGQAVLGISLENENGNLVYGATLADGSKVILDAANGKVLLHEKQHKEDHAEQGGEEGQDSEGNEEN